MYSALFTSILFSTIQLFSCTYLEATANYQKPLSERNNIVNKGVWVRNKLRENLFEKSSVGNFIFRPNSLDADRLLQTNAGTFTDLEGGSFVPRYAERVRRSPNQFRKRHSRKSVKSKKLKHGTDMKMTSKSVTDLNPTSVFNEYPYEVAILLNNDRKKLLDIINANTNLTETSKTVDSNNITENMSKVDAIKVKTTELDRKNTTAGLEDIHIEEIKLNLTDVNVVVPKRSRKHNYDVDDNQQIDIVGLNTTDEKERRMANRNVFDKNDPIWHQNAPIPDNNIYEVIPKEIEKPKGVTERGLIKVISMLTKTFKKTMKQHNELKLLYSKVNDINDDVIKQINDMNVRYQDLDAKYADMVRINNKLEELEVKLAKKEEFLSIKHKNIDANIAEFEKQQQTFLAQQKQFYTIQKVMLAQNEKINVKQETIAKTQSDISYRQNNFARILKKTKQLFFDNRKINKPTESDLKKDDPTTTKTLTTSSYITENPETIKLNLFSIPLKNKLPNQDAMIIKEKDERPIDDLVYKYYFNNTFIDNLMKSKILNNYATRTNSIEIARNAKNKRNGVETTILLPVSDNKAKRVKRWISNRDKKSTTKADVKFDKSNMVKSDPFLTMAKSFCIEIGQNKNEHILHWCIEKALRRLRYMDKKLFSKPVTIMKEKKQILKKVIEQTTEKAGVTHPVDNEELESNLKQYDLTPDMEGAVFYDGSIHLSDIGRKMTHESDGMSDFMPGLIDSNSQVEINPLAIDLQSKRRAYVNRLNEEILQKIKSRRL